MGWDGVQGSHPAGGSEQGPAYGECSREPQPAAHSGHSTEPPKDPRKPLDAEKFTQNEAPCREDDLKSKTGFMCRPLAHDLKNQETIPPVPCPCPAKSASGATGWGSSLVSRPRDGLPSKELPTTGGVAPRPVGSGGCSERRRQSLGMAGSEVEGARPRRAPRQLTDHRPLLFQTAMPGPSYRWGVGDPSGHPTTLSG